MRSLRCRGLSGSAPSGDGGPYNQPLSGNEMPRPGGIASFMRLPVYNNAKGLDACFLGIPFDSGTSNRAGTRFGPRQIRAESSLLRPVNGYTGAAPFKSIQVGDIGDVPLTMYDTAVAVREVKEFLAKVLDHGCVPLSMGGDHTVTYPILQAIKDAHGPVGLIHVDAHADINDEMKGCKLAHGTTFRRAAEEGALVTDRVFQIGLRGTKYDETDFDYAKQKGFTQILVEDCWYKSLAPLMRDIKNKLGDLKVYVTLDIDSLDPSIAPGTGTPEIGGLTTPQMLEIIRGLHGLNIVGGDLVEVSPPYDTTGNTALTGANLLFELLCVLPRVKRFKSL